MSPPLAVSLYSLAILLGALGGALVPLLLKQKTRLVALLSFAAGVMFGAAFFHMLPEAYESGEVAAFAFVPAGFLFLFLLERYVLVHACEEPPDCKEHQHNPAMGLTAFLGLSAHTLFDGIALGSSAVEGVGAMAFIAILAHKIPSSLSLASILKSEGKRDGIVMLQVAAFGLMVPLGAALYFTLGHFLPVDRLAAKALSFSAGTFLYIAVSDLLPHVNRHGKDGRLRNIVGLSAGLLVMFLLRYALPHEH